MGGFAIDSLAWFHPHEDLERYACVIDGPSEDHGGIECIRVRELEERHRGARETVVVAAFALKPRMLGESPVIEVSVPEWAKMLTEWANSTAARYGYPVYLVGSSLFAATVEETRDVDIVCILPDAEFENRFGPWAKCFNQVHASDPECLRWHNEMAKQARWTAKSLPGVNVDFKVQCVSWVREWRFDRRPRVRLDATAITDCSQCY